MTARLLMRKTKKLPAKLSRLLPDLRALVGMGLQQTSGSYRVLVELFNMPSGDYKRFLNFLRKHQCHMPFQQFRGGLTRQDGQGGAVEPQRLVASA